MNHSHKSGKYDVIFFASSIKVKMSCCHSGTTVASVGLLKACRRTDKKDHHDTADQAKHQQQQKTRIGRDTDRAQMAGYHDAMWKETIIVHS